MSSVLLTVKTDAGTKKELKALAVEFGISITSLVNMLVKQTIRDRRITLSAALEPTPYLEKIMRKAEDDYKADRDITHTYSAEEALAHLDSLMKK
jgi:antitoxin component of RelBE/YafQ-DinJ toxin-antitoxin module